MHKITKLSALETDAILKNLTSNQTEQNDPQFHMDQLMKYQANYERDTKES